MPRFIKPLALAGALALAVPAYAGTAVHEGKQLFQANCAECHHSDGRGGVNFGDVTSADLRAPGLERTYRHDDALIVRAILFGKDESGQPLNAPMPKWSGQLSVAQAQDIVAYLHTLKR